MSRATCAQCLCRNPMLPFAQSPMPADAQIITKLRAKRAIMLSPAYASRLSQVMPVSPFATFGGPISQITNAQAQHSQQSMARHAP